MLSNKKKIEELENKTATLETCVHVLNMQLTELQETVLKLSEALEEKEASLAAEAAEIRRWNEGIANIMNYGLDTAKAVKGGGK